MARSARARQLLQRRLERLEDAAGLHGCPTCSRWWDVIELDWSGRTKAQRAPFWSRWPEVDGACPDCGRRPEVFVLHLAFVPYLPVAA